MPDDLVTKTGRHARTAVVGQGIAGSTVAWTLWFAGHDVWLIDEGSQQGDTASTVAAGLMTPYSGKRTVKAPDYDDNWSAAVQFYKQVECEVGQSLFQQIPMLRLFNDVLQRDEFLEGITSDDTFESWEGQLQPSGPPLIGLRIQQAGRLNVQQYLRLTMQHFQKFNRFVEAKIDTDEILQVDQTIVLQPIDQVFDNVVLCQGSQHSELFPKVPNNPARGDILTVKIPDWQSTDVVHRSIWVAPNSDGTQTVGSTYDWQDLSNRPSDLGKADLLDKLERMAVGPVEVIDHRAGVRPTMKDYLPVLGRHPDLGRLFLLNGLGSKGSLRAPRAAVLLQSMITDRSQPPEEFAYQRLLKKHPGQRIPLTLVAQQAVQEVVARGDTVIDATVGNGFDSCFLAETVGPDGRVIGFDIQEQAIHATEQRLQAAQHDNVELRHESHVNLATVSHPVTAVMFNLGYLPRGDQSVMTAASSTLPAIEAALDLLTFDGILTVLSYRGHSGGPEEYRAVADLMESLSADWKVNVVESTPARETSPILFVVTMQQSRTVV